LSKPGANIPTEYRDIFPKLAEIGVLPEGLAIPSQPVKSCAS